MVLVVLILAYLPSFTYNLDFLGVLMAKNIFVTLDYITYTETIRENKNPTRVVLEMWLFVAKWYSYCVF